jgi:hypothetical protein
VGDNEIIKALEMCKEKHGALNCYNCPLDKQRECIELLTSNAPNLINRQKAEIEKLKFENLVLSQNRITMPERLEIVNNARDKAIRDFAEELKTKIAGLEVKSPNETYKFGMEDVLYYRMPKIINSLAKEKTEGSNDQQKIIL